MAAANKRTLRPNRAATVFTIQLGAYAVNITTKHDVANAVVDMQQTESGNHRMNRPGSVVRQHFGKGRDVGGKDRSPLLTAAVAAFAVSQMSRGEFVEGVHQISHCGSGIEDTDITAQNVAQNSIFVFYNKDVDFFIHDYAYSR